MTKRIKQLLFYFGVFLNIALGQIEPFGLEGKKVTSMTVYKTTIYAATDSLGVFQRSLRSANFQWIYIGLQGFFTKEILSYEIDSAHFILLAAIKPINNAIDSTLVYKYIPDSSKWFPFDSGMSHGSFANISSFTRDEHFGIDYATGQMGDGRAVIYKFENGSWKSVYQSSQGSPPPSISKIRSSKTTIAVWAGGTESFLSPFLASTVDNGVSWNSIGGRLPAGGDNSVGSIVFHPIVPSTVYVGLSGRIAKSTDAGNTWTALLQTETAFRCLDLLVDLKNPEHVYAVGSLGSGTNTFGFYETFNGGSLWEKKTAATSLPFARSLVHDPDSGNVIYIGTYGAGIQRYRDIPTALVDDFSPPPSFLLHQNYPNPFNPGTTIAFDISDPNTQIRLIIYDILGRKIRTLLNTTLSNGSHIIYWNGKDDQENNVESGIYFYQLTSNKNRKTKAMTIIR